MDEYKKVQDDLKEAESMSYECTKIIVKWHAMEDTTNITKLQRWSFDRCVDLPLLFQISGDGGCYPCGYLFGNPDYCYGNVCTEDLADILKSDKYWSIIDKVAKTPLIDLCQGNCRHCETNRFVDRVKRVYQGDLEKALIQVCGNRDDYLSMLAHPPEHLNFI